MVLQFHDLALKESKIDNGVQTQGFLIKIDRGKDKVEIHKVRE